MRIPIPTSGQWGYVWLESVHSLSLCKTCLFDKKTIRHSFCNAEDKCYSEENIELWSFMSGTWWIAASIFLGWKMPCWRIRIVHQSCTFQHLLPKLNNWNQQQETAIKFVFYLSCDDLLLWLFIFHPTHTPTHTLLMIQSLPFIHASTSWELDATIGILTPVEEAWFLLIPKWEMWYWVVCRF